MFKFVLIILHEISCSYFHGEFYPLILSTNPWRRCHCSFRTSNFWLHQREAMPWWTQQMRLSIWLGGYYSNSWMVYFIENPKRKLGWWFGGTPIWRNGNRYINPCHTSPTYLPWWNHQTKHVNHVIKCNLSGANKKHQVDSPTVSGLVEKMGNGSFVESNDFMKNSVALKPHISQGCFFRGVSPEKCIELDLVVRHQAIGRQVSTSPWPIRWTSSDEITRISSKDSPRIPLPIHEKMLGCSQQVPCNKTLRFEWL